MEGGWRYVGVCSEFFNDELLLLSKKQGLMPAWVESHFIMNDWQLATNNIETDGFQKEWTAKKRVELTIDSGHFQQLSAFLQQFASSGCRFFKVARLFTESWDAHHDSFSGESSCTWQIGSGRKTQKRGTQYSKK